MTMPNPKTTTKTVALYEPVYDALRATYADTYRQHKLSFVEWVNRRHAALPALVAAAEAVLTIPEIGLSEKYAPKYDALRDALAAMQEAAS